MTISDSFVDSNSTSGLGTVKFERDHLNSETISIALLDAENCFIEPKVMTAKVSYFCALTETSPALFVKKMIDCMNSCKLHFRFIFAVIEEKCFIICVVYLKCCNTFIY